MVGMEPTVVDIVAVGMTGAAFVVGTVASVGMAEAEMKLAGVVAGKFALAGKYSKLLQILLPLAQQQISRKLAQGLVGRWCNPSFQPFGIPFVLQQKMLQCSLFLSKLRVSRLQQLRVLQSWLGRPFGVGSKLSPHLQS